MTNNGERMKLGRLLRRQSCEGRKRSRRSAVPPRKRGDGRRKRR
jgi:hypothetical protein